MTRDWFESLHDDLWLRPDEGGEAEADALRRMLRIRKGQRLLDAPCGAGRVALPLARHGVQVVGLDLRRAFIARGRRRLGKEGVQADLRCMDLRSIEFEDEFHAVCNWFNSFGYLSDGENADVARRFARALRPGGRLLIDQLNRERILRNFRPEGLKHGVRMLSRWDARQERIGVQRVIPGIPRNESRSSQRLYTPAQMGRLLAAAGLEVESVHGSLNQEPYHRGSDRMIVVARKACDD
ncbi:MAG: class I SAM-dependent methyltransferase [Gemmatimonadaceae bacterium]|nr:class I SAM-dependent methyltransferase [Gemmatimonadaceae bacterium]